MVINDFQIHSFHFFLDERVPRSCMKDDSRSLGAGLQIPYDLRGSRADLWGAEEIAERFLGKITIQLNIIIQHINSTLHG